MVVERSRFAAGHVVGAMVVLAIVLAVVSPLYGYHRDELYQIEAVASASDVDVIIASNYGEAGALDRFGASLPPVVSGHNALWSLAAPPPDASTALIVGGQAEQSAEWFDSCELAGRLDNGVGVDNEEEGMPLLVCRDPLAPWSELWERFRHLD